MTDEIHKVGETIGGRYSIMAPIGEGGMQQVYRAFDNLLERVVALKVPKNNSAKKRFHRSAVVSARVNHANVAKTLDYFTDQDHEYLIEELIDGNDLSVLREKYIPMIDPHLTANVLHRLARGLAASHHADVVHRDLKPSNIMILGGARFLDVKITDFGIAKMAEDEIAKAVQDGDEKSLNASLTAMGAIPYMAPEAIESLTDAQKPADVWAIGAIVFELMSGQKPFGSGWKAVKVILDGKPPELPVSLTRNAQFVDLVGKLHGLLQRCFDMNPATRISADELVAECNKLSYRSGTWEFGRLREYKQPTWGFLRAQQGGDVFFHINSFYGDAPRPGDDVFFSRDRGGGADRAFPVVKAVSCPGRS